MCPTVPTVVQNICMVIFELVIITQTAFVITFVIN